MNGHRDKSSRTLGPEMLGQLFDQQGAALELYAATWCAAPADVVQEAFIELAQQTPPPDQPTAWLYRVVRNRAISQSRRSNRRRRREETALREREEAFLASPENLLDAETAAEALEALPAEQAEVVIARIWGGLTFAEIGQTLNISDSAAHRRYQAALRALRKQLGEPCDKTNTTR